MRQECDTRTKYDHRYIEHIARHIQRTQTIGINIQTLTRIPKYKVWYHYWIVVLENGRYVDPDSEYSTPYVISTPDLSGC